VFTDPFSVTYDGSTKSLPRVSAGRKGSRYRTSDGEFEVKISNSIIQPRDGSSLVAVELSRRIPDPTPADVFNDYREIVNTFGVYYSFDPTRAETLVDVPRLRAALLALVDSTFQVRVIAGEK